MWADLIKLVTLHVGRPSTCSRRLIYGNVIFASRLNATSVCTAPTVNTFADQLDREVTDVLYQ